MAPPAGAARGKRAPPAPRVAWPARAAHAPPPGPPARGGRCYPEASRGPKGDRPAYGSHRAGNWRHVGHRGARLGRGATGSRAHRGARRPRLPVQRSARYRQDHAGAGLRPGAQLHRPTTLRRLLPRPADKKNLSIEEIQALREEVALKPVEARHKVYLLREAEDLSEPAANALLKTLEEPPPGVVLLLTASTPDLLLPTLVSRCQQFRLRPVAWAPLAAHLERTCGVPRAEAERLATLSEGRIGWAVRAARDPALLAARQAHTTLLETVLAASTLGRLRL